MINISNNIKTERLKQKLSQRKLAEIIGTSQQQIDLLEKGDRKLTLEWIERIAEGLGISPFELLPEIWGDQESTSGLDRNLMNDIFIAIDDILSAKSMTALEKSKLVAILYDEYSYLPQDNRKEKIVDFAKLYLKTL